MSRWSPPKDTGSIVARMDLDRIKQIVVVMMENRSFDNMLGYLSLPPHSRADVEGLGKIANWEDAYASVYKSEKYRPFVLTDPYRPIDADPPHERDPTRLTRASGCVVQIAIAGRCTAICRQRLAGLRV